MGRLSTRPSSRACVSASIQCRSSKTTSTGCPWLSRSRRCLTASRRALPALGGIERLPVGVLDGHIEQGQQGGQDRLEGPIQREELAGHLLADLAVGFAIVHLEVGPEEVDDRQVAGRLAVGHGARFQDEPVLRAVGVGELVDEAGLPHAGFPTMATSWPRPSCARASARRICSISASRPTNRVSPRAAAAWSRVRRRSLR